MICYSYDDRVCVRLSGAVKLERVSAVVVGTIFLDLCTAFINYDQV